MQNREFGNALASLFGLFILVVILHFIFGSQRIQERQAASIKTPEVPDENCPFQDAMISEMGNIIINRYCTGSIIL